jgi:integrase
VPIFTEDEMTEIAESGNMLFILLAATGLRAGEVLGLEIKHVQDDCSTLSIEQSAWKSDVQSPKTPSAVRTVDVHSSVAALLKEHIGTRTSGLVFAYREGKPFLQSNILRRNLHPLLKKLGIKVQGLHSFRRFRTTWLRKNLAPEDFIKGRRGHASKSVTDEYSKLYQDGKFRKELTGKLGMGFSLIPSVRNEK